MTTLPDKPGNGQGAMTPKLWDRPENVMLVCTPAEPGSKWQREDYGFAAGCARGFMEDEENDASIKSYEYLLDLEKKIDAGEPYDDSTELFEVFRRLCNAVHALKYIDNNDLPCDEEEDALDEVIAELRVVVNKLINVAAGE